MPICSILWDIDTQKMHEPNFDLSRSPKVKVDGAIKSPHMTSYLWITVNICLTSNWFNNSKYPEKIHATGNKWNNNRSKSSTSEKHFIEHEVHDRELASWLCLMVFFDMPIPFIIILFVFSGYNFSTFVNSCDLWLSYNVNAK